MGSSDRQVRKNGFGRALHRDILEQPNLGGLRKVDQCCVALMVDLFEGQAVTLARDADAGEHDVDAVHQTNERLRFGSTVTPMVTTLLRRWQRELAAVSAPVPFLPSACVEAATIETCERILALKGVASVNTVAEVLGCTVDDVAVIVAEVIATESAQQLPGERVRLLADAAARVDARFAADSERLGSIIEPLWNDFHAVNGELKQVVSAWQVREVDGESVPNDHADADYDVAVVGRLAAVAGGDLQMIAHPLRDSYHTVWFELHEELIRLTGRNRADEAAAGRA